MRTVPSRRCLLLLIPVLLLLSFAATGHSETREEKLIIVEGQNMSDSGEYDKAIEIFRKGKEKFPKNDAIISYLGEALFLKGELSRAEDELRIALNLNSQNITAKKYIEKIREINEAQESTGWAKFKDVIWDKIGDFVIFVIGVFLGTFLTSIVERTMSRKSVRELSRLVRQFKFSDSKEENENFLFIFFSSIEEMILNKRKMAAVTNLEEFYRKFESEMNGQDAKTRKEFLHAFVGKEVSSSAEACRHIIRKYIDDEGAEKAVLKIFSRICGQASHHLTE